MLVRNCDPPSDLLTGLKCRATSVAKKIKEKLSQMVFLIEQYLRRCTSTSILFHFHPSDMTSLRGVWRCHMKEVHHQGNGFQINALCSHITSQTVQKTNFRTDCLLSRICEIQVRIRNLWRRSFVEELERVWMPHLLQRQQQSRRWCLSFLYFEHLLKRYTLEHLEFWYLTKFPVGNKADKSF